jgi:hypothetical protein
MAETAFSTLNRRYGSAVRPHTWYRDCRKLVLTAAVSKLKQSLKQ